MMHQCQCHQCQRIGSFPDDGEAFVTLFSLSDRCHQSESKHAAHEPLVGASNLNLNNFQISGGVVQKLFEVHERT